MFFEEWPLIMFTLAGQLAIGSFIVLAIVRFFLSRQDADVAAKLTDKGLLAVGAVMVVASLLPIFHLGSPAGAYRSFANAGSSWLSRESMTTGAFFGCWFLTFIAYRRKQGGSVLAWGTSLVGMAAVLSMANVYVSSIRPAWMHVNTYLAFFGTTFALGSVGALAAILYGAEKEQLTAAVVGHLKKMSVMAGIAVGLPLLFFPVFLSSLTQGNPAAQLSARLLTEQYLLPLIASGILSLAGAGLVCHAVWTGGSPALSKRVYMAFVLVLIGEFMGRVVFYGSAVTTGIGLN
ncbi:MAG TPA: DmsC/YnfH family molybdoenzyme membrane anchor subunit [Patescibacteria group bacterium]|nr:DmsC/YnfH family molybdoenzyme membrane anchor subunit [Patescibacteria group bacterium]